MPAHPTIQQVCLPYSPKAFNEGAIDDLCLDLALVIFDHAFTAKNIPLRGFAGITVADGVLHNLNLWEDSAQRTG